MNKKYDPKEFIKVWQTSMTPKEVAERFKMPKEKACQVASAFRGKGIPLKAMKKGPDTSFNLEELVAIAKKYEKQTTHSLN